VWPIPSGVGNITLYIPQSVQQFTSLNQTIALPPGYRRALAYNLAIEVAAEFDVTPSQVVVAVAIDSKNQIMNANLRLNKLKCDPAMTQRHGTNRFNIFVGE
jgi:hypothetical protein